MKSMKQKMEDVVECAETVVCSFGIDAATKEFFVIGEEEAVNKIGNDNILMEKLEDLVYKSAEKGEGFKYIDFKEELKIKKRLESIENADKIDDSLIGRP